MLVDKGEAPELIPLHVLEDVVGSGIWWGGGYRQLLELGVKVFRLAGVRLGDDQNYFNLSNKLGNKK